MEIFSGRPNRPFWCWYPRLLRRRQFGRRGHYRENAAEHTDTGTLDL